MRRPMAEPCLISARGTVDRHHVSGVSILSGYPLAARFPTGLAVARVNGITLLALITTARHAVADRRARPFTRMTLVLLWFSFFWHV